LERGTNPGKLERFIAGNQYCSVTTWRGNRPHVSLVRYGNLGFTICFVTREESAKARDLRSNPSIALVIQGKSLWPFPPRSALIYGRATLLPAEDEEGKKLYFSPSYLKELTGKAVLRRLRSLNYRPIFVKVEPEKIIFNQMKRGCVRPEVYRLSRTARP